MSKEEEYLKRQKALGYEPSLAGMDEEDFDYVPSWANRQPTEPLGREYKPVDRDFAERMFRMFARPFDPKWRMPDLEGEEYGKTPGFDSGVWPATGQGAKINSVLYANSRDAGDIASTVATTGGDSNSNTVATSGVNVSQEGGGNAPQAGRWGITPSRGGGSYRRDGLADNKKDFVSELSQWPVGSEQFDQTWRKIAKENPTKFSSLQTEYAKGEYYDKAADLLRKELGFDANQRSPALQSVLWSRAVHYDHSNMPELFREAAALAGEPLSTISDEKLIHSIYEFLANEADSAYHVGNGMYHSPKDWVNGSKDVIDGLRNRFLREREYALNMLTN